MAHVHNYVEVVRRSGRKVRKKCECASIGPWVKELKDTTPIPSNNPVVLRTLKVNELRVKAKAAGVRATSKMTKQELIDRLTEVKS